MLQDLPEIRENDGDWGRRGVILIEARLSTKKSRDGDVFAAKEQERIRGLKESRLDAVGSLYAVRKDYLVKNNIDVLHGVTNGTLSTLQNAVLHPASYCKNLSRPLWRNQ